jgi:hypothetical protein
VELAVVAAASAALSLAALAVLVILARRLSELQAALTALARRQGDLQERVAAAEAARRDDEAEAGRRARVTARFDPSFGVLQLANDGPAPARGVTVEVAPIGDGHAPALDLAGLPVDLRPGQRLFLDTRHRSPDGAAGGAAGMTATVRWTDGTGVRDETFVLTTRP